MIPILYDQDVVEYTTNGIGRLVDAISCTVTEERNGSYELEMVYPISGQHFEDIALSRIIAAKPSKLRDLQGFRIYKISRPINGQVTISARHISYQLSYIICRPFEAEGGLSEVFSNFQDTSDDSYVVEPENNPFTFETDIEDTLQWTLEVPSSIRSCLGDDDDSVLGIYGGEYEWDNYTVHLWQERGEEKDITVKYGKNLIDITQETNIEETITGVYGYWYEEDTMIEAGPIYCDYADNYPFKRIAVVDFTENFDDDPDEEDLEAEIEAYITANDIGLPVISMEINFVNLADTDEYKDLESLQECDLCDTITVEFVELGVSGQAEIITTVYDVLNNRFDSIELGEVKSYLEDTIADEIQDLMEKASYESVSLAVDRATGVLNSGTRGYVIINRNSKGWANEILFLDNSTIADATKVLRINNYGIGFSSSGYEGPYYQAWTLDGHLSLGGVNNSYGYLELLDDDGNAFAVFNKDGIYFYNQDGDIMFQVTDDEIILRSADIEIYDDEDDLVCSMSSDGVIINKGELNAPTIVIDDEDGSLTVGDSFYADNDYVRLGGFEARYEWGRDIFQSEDEYVGLSCDPSQTGACWAWFGWVNSSDYDCIITNQGKVVAREFEFLSKDFGNHGYQQLSDILEDIYEELYDLADEIDDLWDAIDDIESCDCDEDCEDCEDDDCYYDCYDCYDGTCTGDLCGGDEDSLWDLIT